jgi:hypothetical protein
LEKPRFAFAAVMVFILSPPKVVVNITTLMWLLPAVKRLPIPQELLAFEAVIGYLGRCAGEAAARRSRG